MSEKMEWIGRKVTPSKWTEEKAKEVFIKIFEEALKPECYSIQQARMNCKVSNSTFYWLANKFDFCKNAWETIKEQLISDAYTGGLQGELDKTLAIFLLKNLGEVDKQEVTTNSTTLSGNFTTKKDFEEAEKYIKENKKDFDI